MKKLISILLCAMLLVTMVACNNTPEEITTDAKADATTEAKADATTEAKADATTEAKEPETTEAKEPETTEAKAPETTEAKEPETTEAPADLKETTNGTLTLGYDTASVDLSETKGYKWDKDNLTLTLCGINLVSDNGIGIKIDCTATIIVAEGTENTIVVTGQKDLGSHGILASDALIFKGTGILNITAGDYTAELVDTGITAYGICAKGKNVEIDGPTFNIACGTVGGENLANLRNIQGIRCQDLSVKSGSIDIQTGDCYTTVNGAFLDGIYATGAYNQTGGNVKIFLGYCHIIGENMFRENLPICADGSFTITGGNLELQGTFSHATKGKAISSPKLDFGDGIIKAGNSDRGNDTVYEGQLYLKVTFAE